MSSPLPIHLCALAELPEGSAREGREFFAPGNALPSIFVLRGGRGLVAYLNRCPHRRTPLNWTPDRFLDEERRHVVCATHGALFRVEDGRCLAGPCQGDALEVVAVEVRDGEVYAEDWTGLT